MQGGLPASDSGRMPGQRSVIGGAEVRIPTIAAPAWQGASHAPSIEANHIGNLGATHPTQKATEMYGNTLSGDPGACWKFTVEFC